MKTLAIVVGPLVVFFVLLLGVGFAVNGTDFVLYKFFGPKRANLERSIYENTHSYNAAMIQELEIMQLDYIRTDNKESKKAIAAIFLHRIGDYDETKLPPSLYAFLQELRRTN